MTAIQPLITSASAELPIHEALPAQPRVSVVVAAETPHQWLDAFVAAIPRHTPASSLEVIVVRASGHRSTDDRPLAHPLVRYVGAPPGAEAAELRRNGIRHASGDVIVLCDGRAPLEPGFIDSLLLATTTDGTAASRVQT